MTDTELVERTRDGCAEAYEELVNRWAGRVSAVCHAMLGRHGPVDDFVQEAFLRGFRGIGTLSSPDRFGSWLCGIARRTCLDWLKARERSQRTFSDLGAGEDPASVLGKAACDPEIDGRQRLERREELEQVLAEIDRLPEKERAVILLFYYDEMTYRDIAEALDVAPATVNKWLTRARARLRTRLHAGRAFDGL